MAYSNNPIKVIGLQSLIKSLEAYRRDTFWWKMHQAIQKDVQSTLFKNALVDLIDAESKGDIK